MKKLLAAVILSTMCACTFSNQYGDCIGLTDDKDPQLNYQVSTRNVIWTIIGSESFLIPLVWALYCVKCPIGKK